jgi:hypothetical protein
MKNVLTMAALVAAVACSAATAQAANVTFTGVLNGVSNAGQTVLSNGDTFTLNLDFNAANASTTSVTTATTLTIDTALAGVKTLALGSGSGSITLTEPTATSTQAAVSITFTDNSAIGSAQPQSATFTLNLTREQLFAPMHVTQANMSQIFSGNSSYTGSLANLIITTPFSSSGGNFSGTIPVPEPGSIGLLAGLGCVVGRRLWRRRQQKQTATV